MNLNDLNPHIRYAREHYNLNSNSYFSKCYDCRIFFIKNGTGTVIANGREYNISHNFILYFPPRTEYKFQFSSVENPCVLVFDFDLINEYSYIEKSLGTSEISKFVLRDSPDYEIIDEFQNVIVQCDVFDAHELLKECVDAFLQKSAFYREISSANLKRCLIKLLIDDSITATSNYELIKNVQNYIYQNYSRIDLKNEEIAEVFNYHSYYLNKIFKNSVGTTIHQFINVYRMRMAKNYLLTTDLDIKTISWKVGYGSTANFIKTFRGYTGITPKKYREKNKMLF